MTPKKIYIKDLSFEAPSTPEVFTREQIKPTLGIEVLIDFRAIDKEEGLAEIILKVTVTSKHEDNIIYIAEVHQAGLFQIQHPSAEARQMIVEVTCPTILLPFAREELNSLISKGGFNNFLLAPMNFEGLYRAKKAKEMDQSANADSPSSIN